MGWRSCRGNGRVEGQPPSAEETAAGGAGTGAFALSVAALWVGENIDGRDPPVPLEKCLWASGRRIARREQPLRLPPRPPLRKGGGGCLRASGRRACGENNLCAYPPGPPFVRGGGCLRASGARACGENNLCAYPPGPPLRSYCSEIRLCPIRNAGHGLGSAKSAFHIV